MAAELSNSVLLKHLTVYQWIFSLFGLNCPPVLMHCSRRNSTHFLAFTIYALYSVAVLAFSIRCISVHNKITQFVSFKYHLDILTEVMSYIQNVAQAMLVFLMEYKTWCCSPKLVSVLRLSKKLEDELLRSSAHMFDERNLQRRLLRSTGAFFVILFAVVWYVTCFLIAADISGLDKMATAFFIIGMQMKCQEYNVYMQLISEYLGMLLQRLKCLRAQVASETDRRQPLPCYYLKTLQENQMLLRKFCSLAHQLENYFAWPLLLIFLYNGLIILTAVNWAYLFYGYNSRTIIQIVRLLHINTMLLNMLSVCYVTQKCINEYQQFSRVLINFKLFPHDRPMIMAVKEYSLQLLQQPLKFTCSGYMDINLACFGKVILIISTYAIILLQFKLTDLSEGAVIASKFIFGKI